MRALLAPAAALLALAGPVALTPQASAESTTLKAVIFEEVKPLYQKTDAGYEGLGVDVLEQIRIQAKRRKVGYRRWRRDHRQVAWNDGMRRIRDQPGKADARMTQNELNRPFSILRRHGRSSLEQFNAA